MKKDNKYSYKFYYSDNVRGVYRQEYDREKRPQLAEFFNNIQDDKYFKKDDGFQDLQKIISWVDYCIELGSKYPYLLAILRLIECNINRCMLSAFSFKHDPFFKQYKVREEIINRLRDILYGKSSHNTSSDDVLCCVEKFFIELKNDNKDFIQYEWQMCIQNNILVIKKISEYLNPLIDKTHRYLLEYYKQNSISISEYWFNQVKQCIDNFYYTDEQLISGFSFNDEPKNADKTDFLYISKNQNEPNETKLFKQYYIILKFLNAIGNFGQDKIFSKVIEYIKEIENCILKENCNA